MPHMGNPLLDYQLTHLFHKHYYLGTTYIFGEVAYIITYKIVVIRYSGKKNYVKLIHVGKCTGECISSCFNNCLTSSFPLGVKARGTGPKLNVWINRKSSMASPRSLKVVTRGSPYIVGQVFKKTLVTFLMSLL